MTLILIKILKKSEMPIKNNVMRLMIRSSYLILCKEKRLNLRKKDMTSKKVKNLQKYTIILNRESKNINKHYPLNNKKTLLNLLFSKKMTLKS